MLGLGSSLVTNQYREFQKRVMLFDGSDDFLIGPSTATGYVSHDDGSASKISISAWIKMDDLTSGMSAICTVYKTVSGAREWYFVWNDLSNNLQFVVSTNGTALQSAGSSATNTINDTDWHHVAVVYDGSEGTATDRCQMYIDGSAVTTSNSGGNPARIHASSDDSSRLIVGAWDKSTGVGITGDRFFEGRIADLFIISRYVFTAANVTDFYNNGRPKNMSNFQSSNARRVYYRADNYLKSTTRSQSNLISDSINQGLGAELVDSDKRWTGDTTGWENVGTNTHAQDTTDSIRALGGLPTEGESGEEVTGVIAVSVNDNAALIGQRLLSDDWLSSSVSEGDTYRVSFWAKKSDGIFLPTFFDGNGDVVTIGDAIATYWQHYACFLHIMDTSETNAGISTFALSTSQTIYMTGFSVRKVEGNPITIANADWQSVDVPVDKLPLDRVKA
jgi:hypothetical protein